MPKSADNTHQSHAKKPGAKAKGNEGQCGSSKIGRSHGLKLGAGARSNEEQCSSKLGAGARSNEEQCSSREIGRPHGRNPGAKAMGNETRFKVSADQKTKCSSIKAARTPKAQLVGAKSQGQRGVMQFQ